MYNKIVDWLNNKFPFWFGLAIKYKLIIKYIIAGGTAASTDLVLLYIFTDLLGIHYLVSATLAFMVAIIVSFNLQKHWTFRDTNKNVGGQMTIYVFTGVVNLGINALIMYGLVDRYGIPYLLAQIFAGGTIAIGSFMVYRFIIFKKKPELSEQEIL